MNRRNLLFALILLLLGVMLVMPPLLRAIPSRYVARLPKALQQLGAPRDQISILPTVLMPGEAQELLLPFDDDEERSEEAAATTPLPPPATPTPIQVADKDATSSLFVLASATPPMPPSPTPVPIPFPSAARLEGLEHTFQSWNNCGPATLAMTLSYFDLHLTQNQTAAVLKPNPEDRNVSPHEMVEFVRNETELAAIERINGDMDTIRRLVSNGIPVILEIGIDPPGEFRWLGWYGHYLLVVAYDDAAEQLWVYDSWFGTSEEPLSNENDRGRILSYSTVGEYWPHFNRTYMAVYRKNQADLVSRIIGEEMDDEKMWQNALVEVRAETAELPENAFLWFNLGTIYNALERYEDAATAFDQARSIGLPWRMLWYQFGPYQAYQETGRFEDVLLLTEVTLKDRPYFEESFYYRGLALLALGNLGEGRATLEQAVEFNPSFEPAVAALAETDG